MAKSIDIVINGDTTQLELGAAATIGDVLKTFEVECEKQNGAVIGIRIDGEEITAKTFDEVSLKPYTDKIKFDFDVVTKEGVDEELAKFAPKLEALAERLRGVGVKLQTGHKKEVAETLAKLSEELENLCYCIKLSAFFDDYGSKISIDGVPFNKFFEELSPILKDLVSALESDDSVTVGDLSEYEIADRLVNLAVALKGIGGSAEQSPKKEA